MPEQALSYALTTKTRVKDRLGITGTNFDILLDRLINAVTDFIEGECGGRRFLETTYTNEVYSIYGTKQKYVFLRQAPVSQITAASYKTGTPSNPVFTPLQADDFELEEDGKTGIVRIYGNILGGTNRVRFSYIAGYKIDFANAGNIALHNLPADITELADRLVIRAFKRREAEGKLNEAFEGGNTTWLQDLTAEDKEIIAKHHRLPFYV